jgi:hypothetical protein
LVIDARQCAAPGVHPGYGTPRLFFFQAQSRSHLIHAAASAAQAASCYPATQNLAAFPGRPLTYLSHASFTLDCNIYVRSQRAGERVMQGITRFITHRLKLKVNETKSAARARAQLTSNREMWAPCIRAIAEHMFDLATSYEEFTVTHPQYRAYIFKATC